MSGVIYDMKLDGRLGIFYGVLDHKIDFKSFNDGITVFEYLQNNL